MLPTASPSRYEKTGFIIITIMWCWFTIVFLPGSYTIDSWEQLLQVTTNNYNDWHNPFYSVVWKFLMLITGQYFSIFLLQMFLYWYFMYQMLVVVNKSVAGFVVGIIMAVFYIFIPQYIMKDAFIALLWAIGTVWLLKHTALKNGGKGGAVLVGLLFLFGFLTRVNAIFGFLPLIYTWLTVYVPRIRGMVKKSAMALAIAILSLLLNNILTYGVLNAKRTYPQYKLMLLDVIGITKLTGTDYIPQSVKAYPRYNHDSLMARYHAYTVDDLYWPVNDSLRLIPRGEKQVTEDIFAMWKKAISEHPGAYLQNRWEGYIYYLRIKTRKFDDGGDYWDGGTWIDPGNPYGIKHANPEYLRKITNPYYGPNNTFIFAPWFWLMLNAAGALYYFLRYRKYRTVIYSVLTGIQLSGLIYLLSFFFVYQNDRDFRFNYWNVLVALIGVVYLLHDMRRRKKVIPR